MGAALVVAAIAMVVLLRRSLTDDVRTSARMRAAAIAVATGTGLQAEIDRGDDEEEFVQVLDRDGAVVASSTNLAGSGVVARPGMGGSQRVDGLPFEDDPFLAVEVSAPGGSVVVGQTLESVDESTAAATGLLAGGIPLLLLVVGAVTWRVVGRALAPVEAMRAEVEVISTAELYRRVPTPPGKDEIARLAQTMNRMLARLEGGHVRMRRFVSDASHELRSPVTTLRQHAEVARAHPETTAVEEFAEVVEVETVRLAHIIDDLLVLAAADEGVLAIRTGPIDLDDVVLDEVARARRATDAKLDVSRVSGGRVIGDRRRLEALVSNLLDNAVRHANRRVEVGLIQEGSQVVLVVDDDGPGIPASQRARVLERFVRLDEARGRGTGGSGLGLAIVSEVAAAHGGAVEVLDGPLGGARVRVTMPASSG